MKRIELTLAWPPSVNSYYGTRTTRAKSDGRIISMTYVTDKGRDYQKHVEKAVEHIAEADRIIAPGAALRVHVLCWPPDRRARDLGNLDKGLMDSLQYAGVMRDDADIWELRFTREALSAPPGRIIVRIWPWTFKTWETAAPCS